MKRIFIALLATIATISVSAQEFNLGVVGGLNLAWERVKAVDLATSSDSYLGFQVGAKIEMNMSSYLTNGFYVEGSLLYNLKGTNYAGSHTNLGYLQLPVNLGYRLPISGNVSLMGAAGPYVAIGVLGKDVETSLDSKIKTNIFGKKYQRFDFGLNYKLGVELWHQWQLYFGFEQGLINMAKSDYATYLGTKRKTMNLYIGTAYMF